MINPGRATIPKAWRHPHREAMNPPMTIPAAIPRGMEAFQIPTMKARFFSG